jgi:hypothetical protein
VTAEERAREIDRQEFEDTCRLARERAHQLVAARRAAAREQVADWIARPLPAVRYGRHSAPQAPAAVDDATAPDAVPTRRRSEATLRLNGESRITLSYIGLTLTLTEWADRTGISPRTLHSRLVYGWPVERILTVPPNRHAKRPRKRVVSTTTPGVPSDFPTSLGTGGGSAARHSSELEFSK